MSGIPSRYETEKKKREEMRGRKKGNRRAIYISTYMLGSVTVTPACCRK